MKTLLKQLLSEFLGTAVLMMIGVSAIVINLGTDLTSIYFSSEFARIVILALMFAFGVVLVIYSPVGHISGAHINPAVSFAFWLTKKMSWWKFILFSLSQTAGSFVGTAIVTLFWGRSALVVNAGMTLPGKAYAPWQAFLTEIVITFSILVLILVMSSMKKIHRLTGLAAGAWVAVLVILTAGISGTSLNPARSIGPALVMQNFDHLWIYLIAPMIGSFLAVYVIRSYKLSPLCAKLNHPKGKKNCSFECVF